MFQFAKFHVRFAIFLLESRTKPTWNKNYGLRTSNYDYFQSLDTESFHHRCSCVLLLADYLSVCASV